MTYKIGEDKYELVDGWAKLQEGESFVDVCGIAIDSQDRVYILNRGDHPIMVLDRDGNVVTSWGDKLFGRAHGSCIDSKGYVYCTDDKNHTVRKFTTEGDIVMILGNEGQPSDTGFTQRLGQSRTACLDTIKRGGPPFNGPTGVSLSTCGEIFVSDGYCNARVHKFSPDGKLLLSWGEPGQDPCQFKLPHSIWVDRKDRVWVPDRENNRIQIFNAQGEFLDQWTDLGRPTDIFIKDEEIVFVSELNQRVSIFNINGHLIGQLSCQGQDKQNSLFVAPHAIAVDSKGDIYVGEVCWSNARINRGSKAIQKFAKTN